MEDMDASCDDLRELLKKIPATTTDTQEKQIRDIAVEAEAGHCDSSTAGYYYQRGIANYNLVKYDRAIEWYNRGLAKFPDHCMMTSFRGNAYLAAENYRTAEADYTRSIELRPKLIAELQKGNTNGLSARDYANFMIADIYRMRAKVRLSLNNYAGAMVDVEEGIALIDPQSEQRTDFFKTKGDIFLAQNDNSSAFTWYNKALQVTPNFPEALANRALVKLNLAYRVRVISPSIGVNNSRINLPTKTQQIVNKDNLESALADCNKAIAGNPQYGYAYYVRSMIKEALEQSDYCYDLFKAESLGLGFVKEIISEKKCR
jgi:tetratricopeptide (TPR) repeat protein